MNPIHTSSFYKVPAIIHLYLKFISIQEKAGSLDIPFSSCLFLKSTHAHHRHTNTCNKLIKIYSIVFKSYVTLEFYILCRRDDVSVGLRTGHGGYNSLIFVSGFTQYVCVCILTTDLNYVCNEPISLTCYLATFQ